MITAPARSLSAGSTYVKLEATVKAFKGILNGDYDHLAEDDFYMVGDIDMALAKYQKRQEN